MSMAQVGGGSMTGELTSLLVEPDTDGNIGGEPGVNSTAKGAVMEFNARSAC
jgi:hypothetical protein